MKKLLSLCIVLCAFDAQAQLIECIDSKGNSRYSETPCGPNERDPRKIYRRSDGNRPVVTHDSHQQDERARKDQEREAVARAAEEERRLKEMIRIEQLMRKEAAAAMYNQMQAEREAAKAAK